MVKITEKEKLELMYLKELGYKYIGRHEKGHIEAFKRKPVRDKVTNGNNRAKYDTWVIGKYPIKDFSEYYQIRLGVYSFLTWTDGLKEIEELLKRG